MSLSHPWPPLLSYLVVTTYRTYEHICLSSRFISNTDSVYLRRDTHPKNQWPLIVRPSSSFFRVIYISFLTSSFPCEQHLMNLFFSLILFTSDKWQVARFNSKQRQLSCNMPIENVPFGPDALQIVPTTCPFIYISSEEYWCSSW